MKYVAKDNPEPTFEAWKSLANKDWTPTYTSLQNPEKGALHASLLREQGWVCCYCGRNIAQDDSHIEHFFPQEHYEEMALKYENLYASCIRATKPGAPLHCGHAKGATFDESQHISPGDLHCESRFLYTMDGGIVANDEEDIQADFMISLLHLNIPFLRNRRESEVNSVFDPEFLASVTGDELRTLYEYYRTRDAEGRLPSFGHVLARFAEQRLLDIVE